MDLSELVASVAPEPGPDSLLAVPGTGIIAEIFEDQDRAEAMIATFVWQVFIGARSSFRYPYRFSLDGSELVLVPNGSGQRTRYDLVLRGGVAGTLLPNVVTFDNWPGAPFVIFDLERSFEAWKEQALSEAQRRQKLSDVRSNNWRQTSEAIRRVSRRLIADALETRRFAAITMPAQIYERTATLVPDPAVDVRHETTARLLGTAGVFVNRAEMCGVTVAAHALHDGTNWPVAGTTRCRIGGREGTVVSCDPVSDSCFVKLNGNAPFAGTAKTANPLSGVSPRKEERVTAVGAVSGKVEGKVVGWDPMLPLFTRFTQVKLYTSAMTSPGDSGAALVDAENHVLGFAFLRTPYGAASQESVWIWADSVYHAHNLT
jgi:hypothetical protein